MSVLLQQPFSCPLDQPQVASTLADIFLPHVFDFVFFEFDHFFTENGMLSWLKKFRIKWPRLPCHFQILSQLPSLEDRLNLGDERWNLCPKVSVGFGSFEEVQELLADQVIEGLRRAELVFAVFCGFALFDPNLVRFHASSYRIGLMIRH